MPQNVKSKSLVVFL